MQTPIAYIVFNRPQHTEKTFAVLREQRPSKLFIIADGPRQGHSTDIERCAAVRNIIANVDWPCEVYRKYAECNLGLKENVSRGIDWVFAHVEQAIVLEDDCVAHSDFFRFCDELLERYADNEQVAVITGNNFQNGRKRGNASYYFSKYNHCWGWATWRRAWQKYQGDLPFWPNWYQSADWREKIPDIVEQRYWAKIFERVHAGKIDSWAYPWTASLWFREGLTATPNVNLVSNIGFGPDSTHTGSADNHQANLATSPLGKLTHPCQIEQDIVADRYVFDHTFGGRNFRFPRYLLNIPRRIALTVYRKLNRLLF